MRITYDGPDLARTLETGQTVTRGETIEVPDELGRRLCEQAWFKPSRKTKPTKAPTSARTEQE